MIKLLIALLAAYPLSLINYLIGNKTLRLLYSIIPGFILQYFVYGDGKIFVLIFLASFHVLFSTIYTTFFIKCFGRKVSPFYILMISLIHLSYLHIQKFFVENFAWSMEITTCYMMIMCKFSSIAYSYDDWIRNDDELKSYHKEKSN